MVALTALTVLLVATVFAALGQGGALLYTPMLHWFGYDLKSVVVPLALLMAGLTTLLALVPFGRKGLVDWVGGLPMVAGAVASAPLGALVAHHVPARVLLYLLGVAVALAAARMLLCATRPDPEGPVPLTRRIALGGGAGAFVGFASGMLGIGGGFMVAPVLMWLGYETKRAAATTAYVVTFSSFSGFAGHAARMTVEWPLLVSVLPAVVAGSLAGSWFMACRARPAAVKWLYSFLLLGVAAKLLA